MTLPDGYVRLTVGRVEAWSHETAAEWVADTLESHASLYGWASGVADGRPMKGRGTVWSVPAPVTGPDGRTRWAVRHFRRGGLMAPLLEDRYLTGMNEPRPLAELRCSASVRARGIPTPAVVAAAVHPAGVFYRGDLVTELVPDGVDLRELLFGDPVVAVGASRSSGVDTGEGRATLARRSLREAGRLVRYMETHGVYHPDMNAANLLVTIDRTSSSGTGVTLHLLDLDRCQSREGRAPAPRGPMRERLERSLRKLGEAADRPLPGELWDALRAGYEDAAP